jgi:hypothetical protein
MLFRFKEGINNIGYLALSADDEHIYNRSFDGFVDVMSIKEKKVISTLKGNACLNDCLIVAQNDDSGIKEQRIESYVPLFALEGNGNGLTTLMLSKDKKL